MTLSRRRFLTITAASGLGLAAGLAAWPKSAPRFDWRGSALGAEARVSMLGMDRGKAERLATLVMAEVERLEQCFSLHRSASELSRLNAQGRLDAPTQDFRRLLNRALFYWDATDGTFNPAVQPLWRLLQAHFARDADAGGPDENTLEDALSRADPARISVSAAEIRMAAGMALTFNGIAQGYITDRVSELLQAEGCRDVLVELGEWRALAGKAWPISLPGSGLRLSLQSQALAVSAPAGTPLSADGRWHHLIDPHSGRPAGGVRSVSVRAPEACAADALSTALAVAGDDVRARIARRFPDAEVFVDPAAPTA
ncbi:MAG: FAD:protein FMN transferase [Rhodovibrionaceae bacterium]|nr:FAD:protein FMN transferase [Rhodovibrionaceae bacterium]